MDSDKLSPSAILDTAVQLRNVFPHLSIERIATTLITCGGHVDTAAENLLTLETLSPGASQLTAERMQECLVSEASTLSCVTSYGSFH